MKAKCEFCGRMIRVHDPATGKVTPWLVEHREKRNGPRCIGSQLSVSREAITKRREPV